MIPLIAIFALGITFFAGLGAWALMSSTHPERLSWELWGVFGLAQLMNIQLGQPGTTFDPTQLIRFPLNVKSYTAIRLFFGILSPANLIVAMTSCSIAVGIAVARPSLTLYALLAMLVFALTNVFFTRMIFAWVDRWLSTRRAREVFTALIFVVSIGFQYVNVTYNPGFGSAGKHAMNTAKLAAVQSFYHRVTPLLEHLPPGLIGKAIYRAGVKDPAEFATNVAGCAVFALVFLAVFAWRMRVEFRGENLSDQANAVAKPKAAAVRHAAPASLAPHIVNTGATGAPILGLLHKELLYLRRNTGLFYGLVAPLVMVLIFAGRFATRVHSTMVFPGALAYALMGVAPMSFNSFGLDAAGTQFYFMAPIRFRDVLVAKNLLNAVLVVLEGAAILSMICYVVGVPPLGIVASTLLWAIGVMFTEMMVGNYRSISTPKKIDPNRTAQKQASPLSALLAMAILIGAAAGAWGLSLLAHLWRLDWAMPVLMLAFAAGAGVAYFFSPGQGGRVCAQAPGVDV